ncbi:T6SS effector amidase Tae4 family protein [Tenacibaculum maritimum]|uniref:T6SS effector amidase Tae4 family protein n=1 Tax=Tenacibaculum maritimum TaxID=107401 RepID=UPI003875DDA7
MVKFITIWNNHPGFANLCNFANQCAIRTGATFLKSNINMNTFKGVICWTPEHKKCNHVLRAQELADWMLTQPNKFGNASVKRETTHKDYRNKKGLVFFKDGWGAMDHIDIWNGSEMKAGSKDYFSKAKEVWFWELP